MITQAEFGFVRTSLSTEDPKYQEVSPINFNRDDYGVIIGLNCIEAEPLHSGADGFQERILFRDVLLFLDYLLL